ncbi:sodium-independent sulfate anion transporter-like [Agrilus planipennis]|uniref:Sodium-independent sulfate anion transporter-like n=1 Tax=Agrilus planipennis TaxID=224129 RepID=A0A7F5RIT6_AGRPL|nr:sodium-independent sulfate anion transporter-like [Agrilus planipennis]
MENGDNGKRKCKRFKEIIFKRIHILQWLPQYTKLDAVSDVIAGITLGLTMMPQSMAYATLANLPAQYGLYSAFIGSFIYVFFGTIKEVSIGPTSLMALLTLSVCRDLPIEFVILLCFLSGCVELIMGILRLGFLVDFISVPVVSGFTSATSVIIIMAQLKGLLGIKYNSQGIIDWAYKLYLHINKITLGDSLLGIACMIFLIAFKQLPKIKVKSETSKKILWLFSIGRNALIVLLTSLLACYFEQKWGKVPFKIYGNITRGIPDFKPPQFSTKMGNETLSFIDMVGMLGSGVIIVPVIAVLANVAIAKSFAAGKIVDATQEMVTLGLCNILGSFVQSMPATGAFTRSAVSNASGVRTPMAGLYSGTIILLALTFLTPYFYYVPSATLAAVLISAVMFMVDYEIIPKLWKINKFDMMVTIATFCASLAYGVELGLVFGVIISLIPLLKMWTRPKIKSQTIALQSGEMCLLLELQVGFLFPAVDYFTQETVKILNNFEKMHISVVIIDFSTVLRLDYSSMQSLQNLQKTLKKMSITTKFINVSEEVSAALEKYYRKDELVFCYSDSGKLLENSYKISFSKTNLNEQLPLLNC